MNDHCAKLPSLEIIGDPLQITKKQLVNLEGYIRKEGEIRKNQLSVMNRPESVTSNELN